MTQSEMQQALIDALSSGKLQPTNIVLGDYVQHKIDNVEAGGIGVQEIHYPSTDTHNPSPIPVHRSPLTPTTVHRSPFTPNPSPTTVPISSTARLSSATPSPEPSLGQKLATDAPFKYISPYITDDQERLTIHKSIVNLVTSGFRLAEICKQLNKLIKDGKIALLVSTSEQYQELVRLGLPSDKSGYTQSNYENYMSMQKA